MITNLAAYLDFANHHADATSEEIEKLCKQVVEFGFNAAFVNPYYVAWAKKLVGEQGKVGTVIGFPLGQEVLEIKLAAVRHALTAEVDEVDVSLNVALLKESKWDELEEEMKTLVGEVKTRGSEKIIKFILETGYLTEREIKKGSELILESGADFIKTNSGMGPRGAKLEDVKLIKEAVGNQIKIKVAGGIHNYEQAAAFIKAGAARIGSSKAVEIITQSKSSVSG